MEKTNTGKKKKSSKWEFGALFPLGPCLLSVSDRAVAVVDVVGAVVLAWYPVAASGGRKKEAEAAAMKRVRSCAASGARAFALFDDGEIGCLHAPRDEEALVLASARVAAEVEARGDEESADSDADEDDPQTLQERIDDARTLIKSRAKAKVRPNPKPSLFASATP